MTIIVIASIGLLLLVGCGAYLLVGYASALLAKREPMWKLHERKGDVQNKIYSNERLRNELMGKGDPNYVRLDAILEMQRDELAEIERKITQRRLEQAEKEALE